MLGITNVLLFVSAVFGVDTFSNTNSHHKPLRQVSSVIFGFVLGVGLCTWCHIVGLITSGLALDLVQIVGPVFATTFLIVDSLFQYLLPPVLLSACIGIFAASCFFMVMGFVCPVKRWSTRCHLQSRKLWELMGVLFAQPSMQ